MGIVMVCVAGKHSLIITVGNNCYMYMLFEHEVCGIYLEQVLYSAMHYVASLSDILL